MAPSRPLSPPAPPWLEDEAPAVGGLDDTTLEQARLVDADLAGLRIDRCELRSCALDGLAGVERLRGAAMPWADVVGHAGLLASALGIRVLGED
jgi:hypothetical protein